MSIVNNITDLIQPSIEILGYELWGVEYNSSGRYSTLKVYIDSDNGINIVDCETVSKQLGAILDIEEPIATQYNLEVSSPGVDRKLFCLEHYKRFLGFDVQLNLFIPINNQRKFTGTIKQIINEQSIIIATNLTEQKIDFEMINKANLIAQF